MADSEPVQTTGRSMSRQLASAIDNVTGRDRELTIKALSESESSRLGTIHRAVALELRLAQIRDENTSRALEHDYAPPGFHVDGIPDPPAPTGEPMIFDPEAGS